MKNNIIKEYINKTLELRNNTTIKEFFSFLIILLFVAYSILIIKLFNYVFTNFDYKYLYYLILYVLILAFIAIIQKKYTNKLLIIVSNIIALPFELIRIIISFAMPLFALFIRLMYFILLSSLPALILVIILKYLYMELSNSINMYIYVSLTSMIILVFYEEILKLSYKINLSDSYNGEEIKPILDMILNKQSIKFIIYLIYFIFIIAFSINQIDISADNPESIILKTIVQSLVTFLAFDMINSNYTRIKYLPSTVLKYLTKGVIHYIKEEDKDK